MLRKPEFISVDECHDSLDGRRPEQLEVPVHAGGRIAFIRPVHADKTEVTGNIKCKPNSLAAA